MSRNRKFKKLIIVAVVFAFVCLFLLVLSVIMDAKDQKKFKESYYENPYEYEEGTESVRYNGKWYNLNHDISTYLLIGKDQFEEELSDPSLFMNNQCSDFLMLLAVNSKEKTVKEVLINRDTIADINLIGINGDNIGTQKMQITLSHTYGSGKDDSCQNTIKAVSNLFYGIPIKKYYSITMDAVPIITDALDGVPVYINDDMEDVDPFFEKGKEVLITGEYVLPFVRARMNVGEGTNIERIGRQISFMESAKEKGIEKMEDDSRFAFNLLNKISAYSVSNINTSELTSFLDGFNDYTFEDIITLKGEAVKGEKYMEFYPDYDALKELVINVWYQEDKNFSN